MKNTFDDFERRIKNLNEDELGFPVNLADMPQMAPPIEVQTVEVKEMPKPEVEHKEEGCDCPFKKAMEMLDFAKSGICKLKNVPKPEIVPGQPLNENNEYEKIRRMVMASLDFVRNLI